MSRSGAYGSNALPRSILRWEDWAGINTAMAAAGTAVIGSGFSVPPPTQLGYPTDDVEMLFGAPIQIGTAGNGALVLVLAEFTSGAPVVVASQYYAKAFLAGVNSKFDGFPPGEYYTTISGTPRQFALFGYTLVDAAGLVANIRSLIAPPPGAYVQVNQG